MPTKADLNEALRELLAGGGAGMAGLAVGFPLDTIKTHQQVRGGSIWQTAKSIVQTQGFKGLFRGMAVPLCTNGLVYAVLFSSYNAALNYFLARDGRLQSSPEERPELIATYGETFVAGCFGGALQSLVASPVELIKVQMQIGGKEKSPSSLKTLQKIVNLRGYRGMAIGLGATLYRDIHAHGVYMICYKYYLESICDQRSGQSNPKSRLASSPFCLFMAGGVAGTLYWWVCIPMDVVKSRIQGDRISQPKYKGVWDVQRDIMRNEGVWKPLWRGFWAITIRAFPSNGCIFLVHNELGNLYDYLRGFWFN